MNASKHSRTALARRTITLAVAAITAALTLLSFSPLAHAAEESLVTEYYRNACGATLTRSAETLPASSGTAVEFTATLAANTAGATSVEDASRPCDPGPGATKPAAGVEVNWSVSSGPNAGKSGSGLTDAAGVYKFGFTNTAGTCGTDVVGIQLRKTFTWVVLHNGEPVSSGTSPITFLYSYPSSSQVTWTGCEPKVEALDHTVSASLAKRCTRKYVRVTAGARSSSVTRAVVYVNRKRVYSTAKQSFSYKISLKKLTKRSNTVKIVYSFTDGQKTTVSKRVRRCADVSAVGRRSPAFTG